LIEPLPNQRGFAAHLASPIELSAEAPTADEAQEKLAAQLRQYLQQGLEVRSLHVGAATQPKRGGGWLPMDELTQEWLTHVERYRAECDAAERAEIDGETASGDSPR
jgi:hypothetical protein